MKRTEFYIPSSDGKSKIHCVSWKPDGEPVAALQIVHGMMEHMLRYDEFARYLTGVGIAVTGHDHLGHGKSCPKEGFGYFAAKDGEICLLKDMHRVAGVVQKRNPGIPHLMMGHSMGSFFLRRYLTLYGESLDGVIIMGTGDQPLPLVLAGEMMATLIGAVKGGAYRSRVMHELVLGSYNRAFVPNRTANDWLSRDHDIVDRFLADPCCSFYFTCAAYRDFFKLLLDLKLKKQFNRIPKHLPYLLISGEADPVGAFGNGVRRVAQQLEHLGCSGVTLKLYPEARHEIVNETNRHEVYEEIASWILELL